MDLGKGFAPAAHDRLEMRDHHGDVVTAPFRVQGLFRRNQIQIAASGMFGLFPYREHEVGLVAPGLGGDPVGVGLEEAGADLELARGCLKELGLHLLRRHRLVVALAVPFVEFTANLAP